MVKIHRKEGWVLNPNDKLVNAIFKRIEKCEGECPRDNPGETKEDRMCPCRSYIDNDKCCCGLYLKLEE
jgi:ferredoxin-thioredoxin reductase catalytic subunit